MTLTEAIAPYRDPGTEMIRAADGGRDNLPVHTAVFLECLNDATSIAREEDGIRTYLDSCEVKEGVYRRYFGATDENSVDNLVGCLAMAARLHLPEIARGIYNHGVTHSWTYSCLDPEMRFRLWDKATYQPFFGRFPGIVPMVKIAAGVEIGFLSQVALNQSFVWAASLGPRTDVGNRILSWLIARVCYGRYALVDKGIREWRKIMRTCYPGGMREVLSLYHGANHPFAKFAPEDFE